MSVSTQSTRAMLSAARSSRLPLTAFPHTSRAWTGSSRRLASTSAGPASSGSWRGTFVRWGMAGGAIYFYNTSPVFAQSPGLLIPNEVNGSEASTQTIESITAERRRRLAAEKKSQEAAERKERAATKKKTKDDAVKTAKDDLKAAESVETKEAQAAASPSPSSPEELEKEASQQGAFNPETGEINWDCPCLGGMAHGPCGEQFKAAFSCFVFSEEDPKGMDCIDHFKNMQDCFREHPDIYAAELEDEEASADASPAPTDSDNAESSKSEKETKPKEPSKDNEATQPPAPLERPKSEN